MRALAGRTAILTGASRGIGPVIAHALAHAGMHLVLAARSADALERVRDDIRARPRRNRKRPMCAGSVPPVSWPSATVPTTP